MSGLEAGSEGCLEGPGSGGADWAKSRRGLNGAAGVKEGWGWKSKGEGGHGSWVSGMVLSVAFNVVFVVWLLQADDGVICRQGVQCLGVWGGGCDACDVVLDDVT